MHMIIDGHNDLPWALREERAARVDGVSRNPRGSTPTCRDCAEVASEGSSGRCGSIQPSSDRSRWSPPSSRSISSAA